MAMSDKAFEPARQAVPRRNGLKPEGRVGYPGGLDDLPDWGERTCSLRPGDRTGPRAGMCFLDQSGVRLEDRAVAISESFIATERIGERLCGVARGPVVVE